MSTGVITSFTLIDFPSESEMTAFFVFFENNIELYLFNTSVAVVVKV